MARRGICGGCREPLLWAVTIRGKFMPLNPQPDPDGNVAAYKDHLGDMRARTLGKDQPPMGYERVYMPHAATCAAVKERKAQRGKWNAALAQRAKAGRQRRGRNRRRQAAAPDRAGQLRLVPDQED